MVNNTNNDNDIEVDKYSKQEKDPSKTHKIILQILVVITFIIIYFLFISQEYIISQRDNNATFLSFFTRRYNYAITYIIDIFYISIIITCCLVLKKLFQKRQKLANQQREFQTQSEMFSLITAQMEVQQVAIQEQNDLLSSQHKQLELQANMLQSNNEELEKRNLQIIKKTNYITDSIKYAQTIQEAMLPSNEQMSSFFDNFVIYRPKDIVSGDFYWLSVNENYIWAVLGDCTGHGVPGAFMSMIGVRLLGELINENKIDRPSVILEAMHDKIVAALKQDITENTDGMDIAICRFKRVIDQEYDYELKYAGAKQPIYIKRKDNPDVEVTASDRRGIGGQTFADVFFFEDYDYKLNIGDRIYLTSDGIKDQNNVLRKRFGSKRIKMMINYIYTEKIADQKRYFEQILNHWQGLEEQRDDISLWGIELGDKIIMPNNTF
ncbi:MAG: SpoIIE family protein phosphatase [Bacteroidales bacterium]|nr:SpoIIE family protein phosphatase [Bacteroidales bacterium]